MTHKGYVKLKKERIRPVSKKDPLELFHSVNKSPFTDQGYTSKLRFILCNVMEDILHGTFEERVKEFVEIGKKNEDEMLGILLGLSELMRERTEKDKKDKEYMNPSSVPTYFTPIRKLFKVNAVKIEWDRVTQTFPELDNVDDSRDWTREEIRLMLDNVKNARDRALILMLASSGVRRGGLLLRWGDLMRMYNVGGEMVKEEDLEERVSGEPACVAVSVYGGSTYKHTTFLTPEAYQALMDYAVEWEEDVGRKPTDDDPIFKMKRKLLTPTSENGISNILVGIILSAGVWKRQRDNSSRKTTPPFNGFRRRFTKTIKETKTSESSTAVLTKAEFMVGHVGVTKLDRNYYKTNTEELAETYVNAIPNLTISESERLKQANRRSDEIMLGLSRKDDRNKRLEGLNLVKSMLDYFEYGTFADSV